MTDQMLLVLNLGSTSTKAAVFAGDTCLFSNTIRHSVGELTAFKDISGQYDFRKSAVLDLIRDNGFDLNGFAAVVSRGGLLKPIPGGVYTIGPTLVADAKSGRYGQHACNLGCEIAFDLGQLVRNLAGGRGVGITVQPVAHVTLGHAEQN